jgi:Protein of unknown function (DUF433)
MAALDWSKCPAVESVPDRVGGAWVFKGTRLPVATVIENLEDQEVVWWRTLPPGWPRLRAPMSVEPILARTKVRLGRRVSSARVSGLRHSHARAEGCTKSLDGCVRRQQATANHGPIAARQVCVIRACTYSVI